MTHVTTNLKEASELTYGREASTWVKAVRSGDGWKRDEHGARGLLALAAYNGGWCKATLYAHDALFIEVAAW